MRPRRVVRENRGNRDRGGDAAGDYGEHGAAAKSRSAGHGEPPVDGAAEWLGGEDAGQQLGVLSLGPVRIRA
jgi:hypothetical protein